MEGTCKIYSPVGNLAEQAKQKALSKCDRI